MVVRRKTRRVKKVRRKKAHHRRKTLSFNAKAKLRAFRSFEKQMKGSMKKLKKNVERKNNKAIAKGRRELMLLLGECKYIQDQCKRSMKKLKKSR
jgi:hypothetical protein